MQVRQHLEGIKKTALDLSSVYVPVYTELPPFAIDLDSGKLLNPNRDPLRKEAGFKNIQEEIDSYRDEVDLYKILARVAASGDPSFLNRRVGTFADLSNIPDNMNDINFYVRNVANGVDDEVIKIALGEAMTAPEVLKAISDYVSKKTTDIKEVSVNE